MKVFESVLSADKGIDNIGKYREAPVMFSEEFAQRLSDELDSDMRINDAVVRRYQNGETVMDIFFFRGEDHTVLDTLEVRPENLSPELQHRLAHAIRQALIPNLQSRGL